MEAHHRLRIQNYYADLVDHCDIVSLIPRLVHNRVFSLTQIEKYMHGTDRDRKERLFLDVPKRGPEAFNNLVKSLSESNQTYLANLLDPTQDGNICGVRRSESSVQLTASGSTNNNTNGAQPFLMPIVDPSQEMIDEHCHDLPQPLNISVIPASEFCDEQSRYRVPVYKMRSKIRGAVLIINIVEYQNNGYNYRRGAEVDGTNLKELFRQMGFLVKLFNNLTYQRVKDEVLTFKALEELKSVDIVFVIMMGHGEHENRTTKLICSDNRYLESDWIEQQFDNMHFKEFQKKPKVIMFQTCRGPTPDYGVDSVAQVEFDSAVVPRIPIRSRTRTDMLVSHSTLPGYASHRDLVFGTWYIRNFCETVMDFAHDTHLEDIFKLVNEKLKSQVSVQGGLQTSMYTNYDFKTCYLNPLIYFQNGTMQRLNVNEVVNN